MKTGYLSFFVVALVVYVLTTHQKDRNSDNQAVDDNACAGAIEQYREALFPRDRWIEAEARTLAIAQTLNIDADSIEKTVSNYEVGRATAMQVAISQANKSPECTVERNDD
jgi:hypothetical protein